MRIRKHKNKCRVTTFVLVTLFALLQLALWSAPFLPALHGKEISVTCQQDHALCFCSPVRIASGTCCCALAAIAPCCQKEYIRSALKEKAALGAVITSLPCCDNEDSLLTPGSEAYLLPTIKIFDSPVTTINYPLLTAMSRVEYHLLPPVPPPKA